MGSYIDKSGQLAKRVIKRGYFKKNKDNLNDLVNYITNVLPLGPGYQGSEGLIGQLVGPEGAGGGFIDQAIANMQAQMPAYTSAVQRGLAGDFFNIAPYQQYAERQLQREALPAAAQTFATLNTGISSDFTGQVGSAVRDTYLDLAAQDAAMDFQAGNALVNEGGFENYLSNLGAPSDFASSYASDLQNLDTQSRTLAQSATPGAAPLFPSAFEGSTGAAAQMEQSGRRKMKA